ncbi:unnamed protein product [Amoebophrya sp. A25]|nr:unnamed protein product [Amoebophrya sp. A25]|eukprot:GSA25T00017131001.1
MGKAEFEAAAQWVSSLPKDGPAQPSNEEKLQTYGLYKQVTVGDNTTSKPGMFSGFEAGYKWDAWTKHKGKTTEQAMDEYVAHIEGLKKKYQN